MVGLKGAVLALNSTSCVLFSNHKLMCCLQDYAGTFADLHIYSDADNDVARLHHIASQVLHSLNQFVQVVNASFCSFANATRTEIYDCSHDSYQFSLDMFEELKAQRFNVSARDAIYNEGDALCPTGLTVAQVAGIVVGVIVAAIFICAGACALYYKVCKKPASDQTGLRQPLVSAAVSTQGVTPLKDNRGVTSTFDGGNDNNLRQLAQSSHPDDCKL